MIVIENRLSIRTASVPMLYTWLHDQQCFTEFPIFSLRLIVLNGRGRQPAILWHFLRHLVARGEEGPCEISRLGRFPTRETG